MCIRTRSRNGEAKCWKGAGGLFGADRGETKAAPSVHSKALHAKIGELTLENGSVERGKGHQGGIAVSAGV